MNKAGDATITWRYTNRHNLLVAFTYFFVSAYYQSEPIKTYIRKARANNRTLYRQIVMQYVIWAARHVLLLRARRGDVRLAAWASRSIFAVGLPAFFALWTIMFFNYVQHVHTDPWSAHNHSRSFTSMLLNFFLFNNGLHAAHHEQAGAHWSTLRAAHAKIESRDRPRAPRRAASGGSASATTCSRW